MVESKPNMKKTNNTRGAGRKPVPQSEKKQSFTVCCYPEHIAEIRKFAKTLKR